MSHCLSKVPSPHLPPQPSIQTVINQSFFDLCSQAPVESEDSRQSISADHHEPSSPALHQSIRAKLPPIKSAQSRRQLVTPNISINQIRAAAKNRVQSCWNPPSFSGLLLLLQGVDHAGQLVIIQRPVHGPAPQVARLAQEPPALAHYSPAGCSAAAVVHSLALAKVLSMMSRAAVALYRLSLRMRTSWNIRM